MSVTIEQMIGAVDEQASGIRQMVQRPYHDVPEYWTDLLQCLKATSALLRKIAEPSDEELDAAESVRDGVLASEPVRRDMGVTARRNAMRAALATLHQPAPTEDKS